MPPPRVLPDTNVCYPISLLDLILRLDEAGLHEVLWTEDLLRELAATWVRKSARGRAAAAKVCNDVRRAFATGEVPAVEYAHLVAAMPGNDPEDHLHSAAAAARAPATILTANVRDFPAQRLRRLGVTVARPDPYLCDLYVTYPDELRKIVTDMAQSRKRPPTTSLEVLHALQRAGVPRFAGLLRRHVRS